MQIKRITRKRSRNRLCYWFLSEPQNQVTNVKPSQCLHRLVPYRDSFWFSDSFSYIVYHRYVAVICILLGEMLCFNCWDCLPSESKQRLLPSFYFCKPHLYLNKYVFFNLKINILKSLFSLHVYILRSAPSVFWKSGSGLLILILSCPPPRSLEISCCLLNIPRSGGDKVEGMWMKGGRSRAVYRVVYEQRVEWKWQQQGR